MLKSKTVSQIDKDITSEEQTKKSQYEREIARLKSAVEELTVLNDLAITASSSLETNKILDIIVEKSIKAVKAEQGSILLVTEQEDAPLKTLVRQVDFKSRLLTYKVGTHITGWVLKHKIPLVVEDLATDSRFKTSEQESKEIKSVVCVPILSKAKLIGVLMVSNKKTLGPFSKDDVRLLSIIAAQSGQLIRNAQLQQEAVEKKRFEHELALARRIQLDLLPKRIPKISNLDIANYFNPADEVGGDYYDYFNLGEDKLGIVVADVSGHGPSAALVMTMVKGILHSITHRYESCDKLIYEMNSILNSIIPPEMFVTLVFLVIDMKNKKLCYSNAGHNPLVYYSQKNSNCVLEELPGPALGISPNPTFKEKDIMINTEDILVLYTDGVTESINDNDEMYGLDRLKEAVIEIKTESSQKIIENIKRNLLSFTNNISQSDDIALITLKFS